MLALLDPSKMEKAVKVITQLDDKTTGISLQVNNFFSIIFTARIWIPDLSSIQMVKNISSWQMVCYSSFGTIFGHKKSLVPNQILNVIWILDSSVPDSNSPTNEVNKNVWIPDQRWPKCYKCNIHLPQL